MNEIMTNNELEDLMEDLQDAYISRSGHLILITRFPENPGKSSNGGDYYEGYLGVQLPSGSWILEYNSLLFSDFENQGWSTTITLENEEVERLLQQFQ